MILLLAMVMPAEAPASWFSQGVDRAKGLVEKPAKWVAKQSGVKPTVDNANETLKSVEDATKKLGELGPPATVAIQSITRTSDAAGELLVTIKWPVVISAYLCAVWLATLAFNGFKGRGMADQRPAIETAEIKRRLQPVDGANIPRLGVFMLIAAGSLLVFMGMFLFQVWQNPNLNFDAHLAPYLAVATLRSAIVAALLCWIVKLKRGFAGIAIGMAASVVMFALIAIVPSDLDKQQYAPVEPTSSTNNGG